MLSYKRLRNGKIEYKLKWEGCSDSENTWEPKEHLNCPDLILEFENRKMDPGTCSETPKRQLFPSDSSESSDSDRDKKKKRKRGSEEEAKLPEKKKPMAASLNSFIEPSSNRSVASNISVNQSRK